MHVIKKELANTKETRCFFLVLTTGTILPNNLFVQTVIILEIFV